MNLTLSKEVSDLLSKKGETFLFTLNDGSNSFSNAEGCCMIGDRFLIVPVKEKPENYDIKIPSNQLHFYTSKYDTMFLKGELFLDLDKASHTMVLKDKSGILDHNVQISDE